ncbi:MAG: PAS domain S-box protein, partial [Gammaproteobacteria bacterium]|nr:PAS domain S-box protein [Gammaproteobacteria bacterium]
MNAEARANQLVDLFFKDSHTCFVLLDVDFNFIRVNEAYAKVCGQSVDYFPGKNHFELYPSDVEDIFKSVRDNKKTYSINARPFAFPEHPEWGTTYWDWVLEPILNDQDDIDFFVFSLKDVTDRVRAEDQRDRFFGLSADMLCIASFEGYFVDLSSAWAHTLGYSDFELKAVPFIEFVHPDDQAMTIAEASRLSEEPDATINFVNRYRTKSGEYRWLSWNAIGAQDSNQIYAVAHDITVIKQAEENLKRHQQELEELVQERTTELRASQSRLNFLLESSPAVIYTCRADGDFGATFISDNVKNVFGYMPDEFVGQSDFWISHIHPDDRQRVLGELGSLFEKGF